MSGALSTLKSIAGEYLQCSFRGVPFAVVGSGGQNGRNFSVHRYPFRDTVWAEDLGKAPRLYRIRGFVCGPLCLAQRDLLVTVTEQKGPGLLVHPSLGVIQAACLRFEWREREGVTGVVDLEFEFVEQKNYLSTTILTALHAAIGIAAMAFSSAASSDYQSDATSSYQVGASVGTAASKVAAGWAAGAASAIRSPGAFGAAVATLPGNNGRYAGGNAALVDPSATVSSALAGLTVSRQAVDACVAAAAGATDASSLATAVLDVPEALRVGIVDPGVQIDLLSVLTSCTPQVLASSAPIGGAMATVQIATAALCRQAALVSIAMACADWQPTTSDEAEALRQRVGILLDDEATIAADAGNDATWQALRALRAQVLQDLADRASRLPDLITVTRNAPLPALVLGQQIYADATRAPELIQRANPIHPAFMPTSFEALSS
ncbi:DNA circularization N-terminal domain-containing protein [Gluconacetobacter azotocaptans]|uniref:DNA circularization protein n=1 Tax=Gluconacetobacter azotocaptans TaxID=142834 RepID=UPI0019589A97|nr:DNA circularization N-terminal domain-containing protein [Gluconacetobacter azotocaptans]MBM9401543.1 DNA circularization N-terminal domain-containing protein [Gluconacetobacter azotocaptans]